MRHDCLQILRSPAVRETKDAVGLAAASARVPCHVIPSTLHQRLDHAQYVVPLRIAFQSVCQHREFAGTSPRPVQVQEIIIRHRNALALVSHAPDPADHRWEQSLQMAVRQEPWGDVCRAVDNWHSKILHCTSRRKKALTEQSKIKI